LRDRDARETRAAAHIGIKLTHTTRERERHVSRVGRNSAAHNAQWLTQNMLLLLPALLPSSWHGLAPIPHIYWRPTMRKQRRALVSACDFADLAEEEEALARYEKLGLFSPLGGPKKQTLAELAAEMAGEPPAVNNDKQVDDDDDDFSTEDALAASQRKLDELLKRAEAERGRQQPPPSGPSGE
jgi:hypothetical protein